MQDIRHFNRAAILAILTVGFSGLQSVLLHIGTTDFAHKYFSTYFFIELFIFLLTVITGLKQKTYAILFLLAFIFETVWFIINERPISPDVLLMLIIGATRIYILIWLLKRLAQKMNKWKIAFWVCLTTLLLVTAFGIYSILDQGVSLTYMKEGYTDTENDLDNLTKIINETDLTKAQISKALDNHNLYEYMDFKSDTISLDRVTLIFRDDKLFKVTKQW